MTKDSKDAKEKSEEKKPVLKTETKNSCGCGCIPSLKTK